MKKILIIIIAFLCMFLGFLIYVKINKPNAKNRSQEEYAKHTLETYRIRTAAYWTSPIMTQENANNLAKHDLVIADLENIFNNREILVTLKKLNPNLKLFCYSNPMEIFLTKYNNRPWQNSVIDEIIENKAQWLLRTNSPDVTNNFATFWPGMTMLNMSNSCPKIWLRDYSTWMAKKISSEILSDTIWDGYFQDNCTANISWVYENKPEKIDINFDGQADSDKLVDSEWKKGINNYLSIIKEAGLPIIGNKGDLHFLDKLDGKFFEKFPNDYLGSKRAGGWFQCMNNAKRTGKITIFQVSENDLMFGLASSLLLDNVYLAIGQDNASNFQELNINLGKPKGKMFSKGKFFYREFQRGLVVVDPEKRSGKIYHKVKT